MEKQYILFIIINNIKRYKNVKKKLVELDYKNFTVFDSLGTNDIELCASMEYSRMLMNSLGEHDTKQYNKTLMLTLDNGQKALELMDNLEELLFRENKQPGTGFMFTVPVYKSVSL